MITEKTIYLKFADGHIGTITSTVWDDADVPCPEDAEQLEEAVYADLKAEMDAAAALAAEAAAEADRAQQKGDYDALVALGLPAEMAQRLSGWQGDA